MAKIILVEDEINIASFIERGLREFGHEVSVVYDGNAGWELLQNESFDLLILDIIMPGMNGHFFALIRPCLISKNNLSTSQYIDPFRITGSLEKR